MIPIPQTTTITYENSVFEVAKMSAELQNAVAYFDDWRQREQELTSDLTMVKAALNDLRNSIANQIATELAQQSPQPEPTTPVVAKSTRRTRTRK